MTDERKQEIISEVITDGERLTAIEFLTRLMDKAVALIDTDEAAAREYIEICDEFFYDLQKMDTAAFEQWRAAFPSPEEFKRVMNGHCETCKVSDYIDYDEEAAQTCRNCRTVKEQLISSFEQGSIKRHRTGRKQRRTHNSTNTMKRQEGVFDATKKQEKKE